MHGRPGLHGLQRRRGGGGERDGDGQRHGGARLPGAAPRLRPAPARGDRIPAQTLAAFREYTTVLSYGGGGARASQAQIELWAFSSSDRLAVMSMMVS